MFGTTIYENIKFGRDNATEDEIREAAAAFRLQLSHDRLSNDGWVFLIENNLFF